MLKRNYFGLNFKILDHVHTKTAKAIQNSESKIWQIPRLSRTVQKHIQRRLNRFRHMQMITINMGISNMIVEDIYPLSFYVKAVNLLNKSLVSLYQKPKQTNLVNLPGKIGRIAKYYPYDPRSMADSMMLKSIVKPFEQGCFKNSLTVAGFEKYLKRFEFQPYLSKSEYGNCSVLCDSVYCSMHLLDKINEFINMHLQPDSPSNWEMHTKPFYSVLTAFQKRSPYDMVRYRPLVVKHLWCAYKRVKILKNQAAK